VTLNGAYSRVVNYDSAHEHELTVETLPLLYALASVIKLYDDAASIIRAIAKAQRTRYGNGRIVARRIGAAIEMATALPTAEAQVDQWHIAATIVVDCLRISLGLMVFLQAMVILSSCAASLPRPATLLRCVALLRPVASKRPKGSLAGKHTPSGSSDSISNKSAEGQVVIVAAQPVFRCGAGHVLLHPMQPDPHHRCPTHRQQTGRALVSGPRTGVGHIIDLGFLVGPRNPAASAGVQLYNLSLRRS
jgi:hypothetical protein